MSEGPRIVALGPESLTPGTPSAGFVRDLAFDTGRAALLRAYAEPGATSGWHHHGDRDVYAHVLRGRARFEYGPGGADRTDVEEGGFFHVPAGLVHRDVNPFDEPHEILLTLVGTGPLVVDVDGPEPAR